MIEVLHQ